MILCPDRAVGAEISMTSVAKSGIMNLFIIFKKVEAGDYNPLLNTKKEPIITHLYLMSRSYIRLYYSTHIATLSNKNSPIARGVFGVSSG